MNQLTNRGLTARSVRRRWLIGLLASGGLLATSAVGSAHGQDDLSKFVSAAAPEIGSRLATDVRRQAVDGLEYAEIRLEPLPEHDSPPVITALAASHDGRFLAAAGDDHAIRIVDVVSGATISTLIGHVDWVQSVVFSADFQSLYSAGNDGRVLKWHHQYPTSHTQVLETGFAIRALTLSTKRNLLAVCGFSNQVVLWDLPSGRQKFRLSCDSLDQRCVRFSPDGSRLLRGGRLGEICVWDTDTGAELAHYRQHNRRVFTAAFSADGSSVTSVGEDRRMIRYDIDSQQVTYDQVVASGKLMSMCLINDHMVAAAGADNSIVLVDTLSNQAVAQLDGHTGTVAVMVACGEFLASGSFDTTIRIWNLERISQREIPTGRPVRAPFKIDSELHIR